MAVMIAQEIGQYLQNIGEGTLGVDILVDLQPGTPDNIISIYDKGGPASQDPPEGWRELYIQVRDTSHQNGYGRIWRVLGFILYPTTAFIEVGTNKYSAQLKEIPSSLEQDAQSRYLFAFRVIIRSFSGITIADAWLNALADWSGTVLTGWQIYKVWPGNIRPSVTWSLLNTQIFEKTKSVFEVRKKYSGLLLYSTPSDLLSATAAIMQELGKSIKLVLDAPNKRYLKITNPEANLSGDFLTASTVSVVLSRLTSRLSEEAPVMSAVHYQEIIS